MITSERVHTGGGKPVFGLYGPPADHLGFKSTFVQGLHNTNAINLDKYIAHLY